MMAHTRRGLTAGFAALITASPVLATAGVAAGVVDLVPTNPDAALLALRPELMDAAAATGYDENGPHWDDEEITRQSERLIDACWGIINAPHAQTPAGLALKAAAAMHQLRFSYGCGGWGGSGEEMAWLLLSHLAGSEYTQPLLPSYLLATEQPARA